MAAMKPISASHMHGQKAWAKEDPFFFLHLGEFIDFSLK
jgi:hypothetical protein